MKLLFLLCVVVLVAQCAVAVKTFSLYDIIQAYQDDKFEDTNKVQVATEALYIPMTLKDCNNSACEAICRALGFRHGTCVSTTTCHCYN